MNCLHYHLPRFSPSRVESLHGSSRKPSFPSSSVATTLGLLRATDHSLKMAVQTVYGSKSDIRKENTKMEGKSDTYSHNMTEAMGAVLTYKHHLGMNYDFIRPDLIVGSCLQSAEDVNKLRKIGVKTIFCLQQNPDLEYFGVDINAIRECAIISGDIEHVRAEIRDFDAFDLRMRLPAVVSKLHKAINRNGGITYIHCTAGLGRAPAVAVAYMFWVLGYGLNEAYNLLMSKRSCFPKLDAIKSATADILTGLKKSPITLTWYGDDCSNVEVSGLDIGWGQRVPLEFDGQGSWTLHREFPEGIYEYKYIVDGEWVCNSAEPITSPNKDGHVNNYVKVLDNKRDSTSAGIWERLSGDDPELIQTERVMIRQFLDEFPIEG